MMKELTILGKTLQYEIMSDFNEYGANSWTEFYYGVSTRTYKKYIFFGELITEVKPKHVFTIYKNIENKIYTQREIREAILRQLELLDREAQINRGEII